MCNTVHTVSEPSHGGDGVGAVHCDPTEGEYLTLQGVFLESNKVMIVPDY